MGKRFFPVNPDLQRLGVEAEDLLDALRSGDPDAHDAIAAHRSADLDLSDVTIESARDVLARTYGIASWSRMAMACRLITAIRADDVSGVERLIVENAFLLDEDARGVPGNWGPPMSYAANLGRLEIIRRLYALGAKDLQFAFERACLQGQVETAKWLFSKGAALRKGIIMGACETQDADGLALLLDLGAEWCDEKGDRDAPVAMLLETYCRDAGGKHRCLEMAACEGIVFPETPVMALHLGRIDLLGRHLESDPGLFTKKHGYRDIYPLGLGCHEDESLGLHGTPIAGASLLHMAVDFDENELAEWMLGSGADPNLPAELDGDGFGGHTPLFNVAISQANVCGRQRDAEMAKRLLRHGADVSAVASIRKSLRFVEDQSSHEYRNVNPLQYARAFHEPRWMNPVVNDLLQSVIDGAVNPSTL